MPHPTTCAVCGEPFVAARATAKYCTPKCKRDAARARKTGQPSQAEQPDQLDDTEEQLPPLVYLVDADLRRLNKRDTVLGQQAIELAWRMSRGRTAPAPISRELDRIMTRLGGGKAKQEDEVSSARRRRDEKRKAAQASQA